MIAKKWITLSIFLAVFAVLAVRMLRFSNRYSTDIFFWDSWDLYRPIFSHQGWMASFGFQHGPHRQGLGGLLMRFLATISHWNSRWDSFAISIILIVSAMLGAWLALRCSIRGGTLVGVPLIYLNIRQFLPLVVSSNPSHGALPVLLITALCLASTLRSPLARLVLASLVTFLSIFTGFGLFVGLVTPVMLVAELIHLLGKKDPYQARRLLLACCALIVTALSWTLFAIGYRWDSDAFGFRFAFLHPIEYGCFITVMLANFFGLVVFAKLGMAAGAAVGCILAVVCVRRFLKIVKGGASDHQSAVIFALSFYSLIFCTQAAMGRTSGGWSNGASSRYVTLMIPMALAILFELGALPTVTRCTLATSYICVLALGTFRLYPADIAVARFYHNGCVRWRLAYLQTHDKKAADSLAHFLIYPTDSIDERLEYLEKNKLNLFDSGSF